MSALAIPIGSNLVRFNRRRGFGDAAQEAGQLVSLGGSVASAGTAAAALPSVGLLAPATAATAIPLIGLGVAAVIGAIALIENSGCGQTCIITADDANKIEPYLLQNLQGYMSGPHTLASQQAALSNFDYFWNYLKQACGQPSLGNAGKNCITDRQAGSCKWPDAAGNCWNWFIGYRDPIANDPNVQASPTVSDLLGTSNGASSASIAGIPSSWLLIAAALLALVWVLS